MKNILPKIASYTGAFTLGVYAVSQFRFNQPIELHRWVITSSFFILMVIISNKK